MNNPSKRDEDTLAAPGFVEEGEALRALTQLGPGDAGPNSRPRTPPATAVAERFDVVVIGGGQAGLSAGYFLSQKGVRFVILESGERIGDAWRKRWDSMHLFTPARFDGLAGMPFPAPPSSFPAKDAMADYLEAYAARFALPVRTKTRVLRVSRPGGTYVVETADGAIEANHVIVAMALFQHPKLPAFARELDPAIVQLHSSAYRNPAQLPDGPVLVVGAGNSGAEIAIELARAGHPTWCAGRDVGHVPFRIDGWAARLFVTRLLLRFVFHHVLSVRTPIGRKVKEKALAGRGGPLIRIKPHDIASAGVQRVERLAGVRDGRPLLEDGRVLDVASVVWATGYEPGFSWIDLPVFGARGEPRHERGIVPDEPGFYFLGLHFLFAMSSTMVHGVERDAARIASAIAARVRSR